MALLFLSKAALASLPNLRILHAAPAISHFILHCTALGLKETINRIATANGMRWYKHVLRRDDNSVLRVALDLEVSGKRKRERPKKTWKRQRLI